MSISLRARDVSTAFRNESRDTAPATQFAEVAARRSETRLSVGAVPDNSRPAEPESARINRPGPGSADPVRQSIVTARKTHANTTGEQYEKMPEPTRPKKTWRHAELPQRMPVKQKTKLPRPRDFSGLNQDVKIPYPTKEPRIPLMKNLNTNFSQPRDMNEPWANDVHLKTFDGAAGEISWQDRSCRNRAGAQEMCRLGRAKSCPQGKFLRVDRVIVRGTAAKDVFNRPNIPSGKIPEVDGSAGRHFWNEPKSGKKMTNGGFQQEGRIAEVAFNHSMRPKVSGGREHRASSKAGTPSGYTRTRGKVPFLKAYKGHGASRLGTTEALASNVVPRKKNQCSIRKVLFNGRHEPADVPLNQQMGYRKNFEGSAGKSSHEIARIAIYTTTLGQC